MGLTTLCIAPDSSLENGYNERFNRGLLDGASYTASATPAS